MATATGRDYPQVIGSLEEQFLLLAQNKVMDISFVLKSSLARTWSSPKIGRV